jgi:hypothetical protein
MSDALERNTVIDLLERLGSERDEDVLAAARALHAQITEAGMNWQDLLVGDEAATPDEPAIDVSIDDDEIDVDEIDVDEIDVDEIDVDEIDVDEEETTEPATRFTGDESKTPELIEKLLAREGNSEEFRAELEEYKTDLAKGDFEPSDHRYIQALYARLTKSN